MCLCLCQKVIVNPTWRTRWVMSALISCQLACWSLLSRVTTPQQQQQNHNICIHIGIWKSPELWEINGSHPLPSGHYLAIACSACLCHTLCGVKTQESICCFLAFICSFRWCSCCLWLMLLLCKQLYSCCCCGRSCAPRVRSPSFTVNVNIYIKRSC